MIFTIAPLVQEAKTRREWIVTLGTFTVTLLAVLAVFGAAMAWAGAAIAARVTTPHTRELLAAVMLTLLGLLALAVTLGELELTPPLLPRLTSAAAAPGAGSLTRRPLVIALTFGGTMAIFSPMSTYALVLGWVAAQQSVWLGAATLVAYGLGLIIPLGIAGTLGGGGFSVGGAAIQVLQERVRVVTGFSMALVGGFLLSTWTIRAASALFA